MKAKYLSQKTALRKVQYYIFLSYIPGFCANILNFFFLFINNQKVRQRSESLTGTDSPPLVVADYRLNAALVSYMDLLCTKNSVLIKIIRTKQRRPASRTL